MDDERLLHLNDEQWAQVEAALPQRRGQSGFERKISNRSAFEAVLYRMYWSKRFIRLHCKFHPKIRPVAPFEPGWQAFGKIETVLPWLSRCLQRPGGAPGARQGGKR